MEFVIQTILADAILAMDLIQAIESVLRNVTKNAWTANALGLLMSQKSHEYFSNLLFLQTKSMYVQ